MFGVTVVVPHWNRSELLKRLLREIAAQSIAVQEVIVVDNGSSDDSAAVAAAAGARVLQMGTNTGFSRAVNAGIQAARTPWVAVLNNDVEPAVDWLERLVKAASGAGAWFATGKLLSARQRETLDGTFDTVCRGACAWKAGHGRPDGPEWTEPRAIWFAPFTAALFRAELFDRAGLLDDRFESYLEDVDFGLRCARGAYMGIYEPRAVACHAGSATLGAWHPETVRRISRNQLFLVAKHFPEGWPLHFGWPVVVAQTLWGLVALRHGTGVAYLRGKLEGLRQYRTVRADASADGRDKAARAVEESEKDLLRLQRQTGFDLYWRLYFALT